MKNLRRHMARIKNILKEGHSDDAPASGGSAEKTASLKMHSPAGAKGSKRTRSPQNQEADAGRNLLARRSSARSRSVELDGEEAAQKAKAEAAENHLKTEVAKLPARARTMYEVLQKVKDKERLLEGASHVSFERFPVMQGWARDGC
jgi:hypothetical protein